MIDLFVIIAAGWAYLVGGYAVAFWIIVAAILNGAFGTIRCLVNPDWYWASRAAADVDEEPWAQRIRGQYSFVPSLLITKGILIAIMIAAAWHVGGRAGYF